MVHSQLFRSSQEVIKFLSGVHCLESGCLSCFVEIKIKRSVWLERRVRQVVLVEVLGDDLHPIVNVCGQCSQSVCHDVQML